MDQVKSLLQTITKFTSEHPYICSFIGISISLVAGYYIYEYVTYIPIVDVLQSSEILIFSIYLVILNINFYVTLLS
jgi:hypothetical protein